MSKSTITIIIIIDSYMLEIMLSTYFPHYLHNKNTVKNQSVMDIVVLEAETCLERVFEMHHKRAQLQTMNEFCNELVNTNI